jgi:hypothetical protein
MGRKNFRFFQGNNIGGSKMPPAEGTEAFLNRQYYYR